MLGNIPTHPEQSFHNKELSGLKCQTHHDFITHENSGNGLAQAFKILSFLERVSARKLSQCIIRFHFHPINRHKYIILCHLSASISKMSIPCPQITTAYGAQQPSCAHL